jgi:hypothetical protein
MRLRYAEARQQCVEVTPQSTAQGRLLRNGSHEELE